MHNPFASTNPELIPKIFGRIEDGPELWNPVGERAAIAEAFGDDFVRDLDQIRQANPDC